jgi:hypothetical protein
LILHPLVRQTEIKGEDGMNSVLRSVLVCIAVAAVVAFCSPAQAGDWYQSYGTAPSGHSTYDSGQDLNGLFGDPDLDYDTFVFTSASFGVSAQNGLSDHQSDTVSFNVHLLPTFTLTILEVRAYGDYLLHGIGSTVNLSATLQLQEFAAQAPEPLPRTFTDSLTTTPETFPLTSEGDLLQGTYAGVATVNVATELPGVDNDLHIEFTNILDALAAQVGDANLNLVFQPARFEITLIPEPATLSLLMLGGLALLRRR